MYLLHQSEILGKRLKQKYYFNELEDFLCRNEFSDAMKRFYCGKFENIVPVVFYDDAAKNIMIDKSAILTSLLDYYGYNSSIIIDCPPDNIYKRKHHKLLLILKG